MARQRLARGRDIDRHPPPAAGAGLGIAGVIVGDHHVDDEPALETLARILDQRDRFHDLRFRRHQGGAVGERPAVILRVGDFEPARAEFERQTDEGADLMQIAAMDDRVDGQRQASVGHHRREGALALPRTVIMTEPVVGFLVGALEGQLRMIEPGFDEFVHQFLADPDAGGDEVGVEPTLRGVTGELDDIASRRRLAAGEMHMQGAERGGLAEHALPRFGVDLGAGPFQRQRIGAIGAAERTAVSEFDQDADRRGGRRRDMGGHVSSTLLALRSPSMATTSFSITAGGA